jgi:hypothetical protein
VVDGDDIDTMRDLAFNICVTTWHLCDWVFGDMTSEQRTKLVVQKLGDLQKRALADRAVHLCRQVAIASKHFEVSNRPDPGIAVVVAATGDRWHIYFNDGERRLPASEVFDLALSFWTQFIFQNGIGHGA